MLGQVIRSSATLNGHASKDRKPGPDPAFVECTLLDSILEKIITDEERLTQRSRFDDFLSVKLLPETDEPQYVQFIPDDYYSKQFTGTSGKRTGDHDNHLRA